MPPAIAKIGTCKLRFCERFNLNFNIATCAGGLLSMGVRLRKNSRWLNASPIVPEPGRVISSGRASKKCRRKPRRGDRLPGGCWRFATVRRRKSNSLLGNLRHRLAESRGAIAAWGAVRKAICQASDLAIEIGRQAAQSLSSRRHQAKTCGKIFDLGGHGSATSFAIEAACGMLVDQTAAGSRAIRIHADASQMQSMWKGPSSPK